MKRCWSMTGSSSFPSHSIGSLVFGSDGALYVSGGDGASWQFVDYGQRGIPAAIPPCRSVPCRRRQPPKGARSAPRICRPRRYQTGLNGSRSYADQSRHGCRAPGQPALFQRRPERAPHRRVRIPQSISDGGAPGHPRDLGRRRRLAHLGRDQRDRRSARGAGPELRLALLRGYGRPSRLRRRGPDPL